MSKKRYAAAAFEGDRSLPKNAGEASAVRDVLIRLGLVSFEITPGDRPDTLVDFIGEERVRVACEVQELYGDDAGRGSELREFRERWRSIMQGVIATLAKDGTAPYCRVDLLDPSYSCLRGFSNGALRNEFVSAARLLNSSSTLRFPTDATPLLNKLVGEITVLDRDGSGLLWWPSHMQSGPIASLDSAAAQAVRKKARLAREYDWQGASEKWLLLVAQSHGLADVFGGAREIRLEQLGNCPFTQVLLWDKFTEDVWTFWPRFHVICDGSGQKRDLSVLPRSLHPFATHSTRYPTRPKRS